MSHNKGEIYPDDGKFESAPSILVFAGDHSLPHNSFLRDQWILTLQKLHFDSDRILEHQRISECKDVLDPDKTGNNSFDWTCGVLADTNSDQPCRWEVLVKMAWCLKQYNSLSSPL